MNKKQNRNKLPLILAALLSIALVAYGSFAYFSDSTTQTPNLELELGSIDIESEVGKWEYSTLNGVPSANPEVTDTNVTPKDGITSIEKVLPGDKYTSKYTFTNNGENTLKLTENTASYEKKEGAFTIKIGKPTFSEDSVPYILGPGESFTVDVSVAVDTKIDNEYNTGSGDYVDKNTVLNLMNEVYEVTVKQANEPDTTEQ